MSLRHTILATASLLCFAQPALAADTVKDAPATAAAANPNAPVTRAELPALVRDALLKDPEMLTEAIKALHDKQMESAQKEAAQSLTKYHDELFKDTASPSIGAKDADVTLVEFFDYHCGYCKRLLPTVQKLVKEDPKLRIVFREFPILSEDSVLASRAALAVNRVAPDKYFDFHAELMKSSSKFDEKKLAELAKKVGVDPKKYQAAFEDKATTDMLDKNRDLAEELGIRGTPALVLPDKISAGALPYDDIIKLVAEQRAMKNSH